MPETDLFTALVHRIRTQIAELPMTEAETTLVYDALNARDALLQSIVDYLSGARLPPVDTARVKAIREHYTAVSLGTAPFVPGTPAPSDVLWLLEELTAARTESERLRECMGALMEHNGSAVFRVELLPSAPGSLGGVVITGPRDREPDMAKSVVGAFASINAIAQDLHRTDLEAKIASLSEELEDLVEDAKNQAKEAKDQAATITRLRRALIEAGVKSVHGEDLVCERCHEVPGDCHCSFSGLETSAAEAAYRTCYYAESAVSGSVLPPEDLFCRKCSTRCSEPCPHGPKVPPADAEAERVVVTPALRRQIEGLGFEPGEDNILVWLIRECDALRTAAHRSAARAKMAFTYSEAAELRACSATIKPEALMAVLDCGPDDVVARVREIRDAWLRTEGALMERRLLDGVPRG